MRIVGGKLRGIRLGAPAKLPVRPTTDMAKEALFNILHNRYHVEQLAILDLFSGTGNIAIEFASREAKQVTAIDKNVHCTTWIKTVVNQFDLKQVVVQKADVFKFLAQSTAKFDIIFADPPYDLPGIPQIPQLVFSRDLLNPDGLLIVEHPTMLKLNQQPHYLETRKYGNSSFSFFE